MQRIQKMLECASIKLASVVSDILGASGRRMLVALRNGETIPTGSLHWATPKLVGEWTYEGEASTEPGQTPEKFSGTAGSVAHFRRRYVD